MSAAKRWGISLAVAVVVGIVAGVVAGFSPTPTAPAPYDSDRIEEAIAGLEQDPFYVAPELRHVLSAEEQSAISERLRTAEVPTYLLYMGSTVEGGYYIEAYLLDFVAERLGRGFYAVVDETMEATDREYGVDMDYVSADVLKTRPAQGLSAYADAMASAEVDSPYGSQSDYWGGPGGGIAAGALLAFLISLGPWMFILIARAASKK